MTARIYAGLIICLIAYLITNSFTYSVSVMVCYMMLSVFLQSISETKLNKGEKGE